jgi:hypothetical protein
MKETVTMLRSTHAPLLRPIAAAGFIAAAAMLAPASAHAQTHAEFALLNRRAPTVYLPGALARSEAGALPTAFDTVDGERALLTRTRAISRHESELPDSAPATPPVSGARALLGRHDSPR